MKHLILLFLWLLQPSLSLRAEQIAVPGANNFVLTESRQTERVSKLKRVKKEVTELKKLRRKKALLITAIVLLPFAMLFGGCK